MDGQKLVNAANSDVKEELQENIEYFIKEEPKDKLEENIQETLQNSIESEEKDHIKDELKKVYQCKECPSNFSKQNALAYHRSVRHNIKLSRGNI